MVIFIRKPETEGTLGSNENKNQKKSEQDWGKVCWREVESD